jgi:hypothetical protein
LAAHPLITEFVAANEGGLRDGYEHAPDWIEIFNPLDTSIDLAGYRLTDNASQLDRWTFPSRNLDPHTYMIVFATGDDVAAAPDPAGYLHTNFKLDRDGGFLALVSPSGEIVSQYGSTSQPYPQQLVNTSYGTSPNDGTPASIGYMIQSTPGEENVPANQVLADFVRDTNFSVDRGFFDQPFQVEITTATAGATIRYTLDGSAPSSVTGDVYSGALTVSRTTILRAIAFKEGYVPTNVDTVSYLFLNDVLTQDGAGLPPTWGTFTFGSEEAVQGDPVPANYEVDPEVVNDPRYSDTILSDLRSLPTVSLVLAPDDLWSEETGIYSNTLQEGVAWERPGSIELLGSDGSSQFQIDAGVRIHGGFGRREAATAKHSFRLFFKGIYGASTLEYPWFGEGHVSEFDTIVLRANYNYSWARGNRTGTQTGKDYTVVNDRWAAVAQTEMGGLSPEGTYVHLYVNGLYWGIYNPTERPDASFQASHRGGDPGQYDVQNHEGLVDGDSAAWTQLRRAVRANPLDMSAVEALLDVDNFIDYMILNQFGGNTDWPTNNWYASRRRVEGEKWQFHTWDAEFFFVDPNANRVSSLEASGPGEIYMQLMESDEFRLRYADRIQQHFFNGGVLTPENNVRRLDELAAIVDRAVVGESARWGDAWKNQVEPARTRDDDWLPRLEVLRTEYFPARNTTVLAQFRRRDLYPQLDAPQLSQHGGAIDPGQTVTLSHPSGAPIYFTQDGSDPRDPSGAPSAGALLYDGLPLAISQDQTIRARAWDGTEWSAKIQAEFIIAQPGDVNHDGQLDDADIDGLCQQILSGQFDPAFDLDHDQVVTQLDHQRLVEQVLGTSAGDANLDRVFNSTDLILVFQAGLYEDSTSGNAGWSTGDWNCDGDFDSGDLVTAFAAGRYTSAANRNVSLEPTSTLASAADLIFREWADRTTHRTSRTRLKDSASATGVADAQQVEPSQPGDTK